MGILVIILMLVGLSGGLWLVSGIWKKVFEMDTEQGDRIGSMVALIIIFGAIIIGLIRLFIKQMG